MTYETAKEIFWIMGNIVAPLASLGCAVGTIIIYHQTERRVNRRR